MLCEIPALPVQDSLRGARFARQPKGTQPRADAAPCVAAETVRLIAKYLWCPEPEDRRQLRPLFANLGFERTLETFDSSVPIPKFARVCGVLSSELRKRTLATY